MVNGHSFISYCNRAVAVGLLLGLLIIGGCGSLVTRKEFYEPITAELRQGNYDEAVRQLEQAREKNKFGKKDRFVYYVDAGLARHYAGGYDSSNARLTLAEDAAEELFTRSISRAAVSLLLNDNALEYAGEDYEILYTNLIKALNFIALNEFDDAFVEIRRANEKLEQLEIKYRKASDELNRGAAADTSRVAIEYAAEKVRFNNDALARYLSMHVYAADGQYDDARIDRDWLARAFREQPHIYSFPMPEVKYIPDSGAILSVVGLAGLAPVKEALNLRLRTDKDLDLVQIFYTDPNGGETEYSHLPLPISEDFYFKFAIPQLIDRPSLVGSIRVTANGTYLGQLSLLEDIGAVARETFGAKRSLIYLRSVARAVAKGLAAHKLKQKADKKGESDFAGWLKKALIDVGTDLTENADLRCSRLLPGRVFVGDFELPPGEYDLTVEFVDRSGITLDTITLENYRVLERGLNMIEAVSLK